MKKFIIQPKSSYRLDLVKNEMKLQKINFTTVEVLGRPDELHIDIEKNNSVAWRCTLYILTQLNFACTHILQTENSKSIIGQTKARLTY